MKLCNYRYPRNAEGNCSLTVDEVSGRQRTPGAYLVFAPEGELTNNRYFSNSFVCKEPMASVCPYRIHIPRGPRDPTEWVQCQYCGHRHRTELAVTICKGYHEWYKALDGFKDSFNSKGWLPDGTTEEIYPLDIINFKGFQNVRAHIWPWMVDRIRQRDKGRCQDCGTETSECEVHHIIPRGLGGSDHPANLKLVCKNCHQKYNEKFNGQIISQKAKERKTAQIHENHKPLEAFKNGGP